MAVAVSALFFLFCYGIACCRFYGLTISSQVLRIIICSVYFDDLNLNGRIRHFSRLDICIFIHGDRYRHGFYISVRRGELLHDIQGTWQPL